MYSYLAITIPKWECIRARLETGLPDMPLPYRMRRECLRAARLMEEIRWDFVDVNRSPMWITTANQRRIMILNESLRLVRLAGEANLLAPTVTRETTEAITQLVIAEPLVRPVPDWLMHSVALARKRQRETGTRKEV